MASPKPSLIDFKHLKAAEGFVELGMYLEAEDELGQIDPYCLIDPQVLRVRLELYAGLQNWGLMQMVARRLTQCDPGKVQWRISLAYATRRAESIEAAKSILIDALESHPEEGIVHYSSGLGPRSGQRAWRITGAAGNQRWPNNALRHSFASYYLAHFKKAGAAELALEMGHTNANLVFQHYRELVKPRDAKRYWNIMPAGRRDKVILLAKAA